MMPDDLYLPASIPGMAEAATAVLGFDPWEQVDEIFGPSALNPWWTPGPRTVVPLSIPAGRLVALEWLRARGESFAITLTEKRMLDEWARALYIEVLRIARKEGWSDE